MTFSLLGRCVATGQIGAAVTTSSIAVGSRVAFCAPGIGGVLTQHRTDPRLGPRGVELLRSGCTAEETLAALVAGTPHAAWRQIGVLDATGRSAAFSGGRVKLEMSEVVSPNVVAVGNILSNHRVTAAMATAFNDTRGPLAHRLVRGLEAGLEAGGEHGPVRSASVIVYGEYSFPLVDLRVDWHETPIAELRALWERYAPMVDDYVLRAIDPDNAPVR